MTIGFVANRMRKDLSICCSSPKKAIDDQAKPKPAEKKKSCCNSKKKTKKKSFYEVLNKYFNLEERILKSKLPKFMKQVAINLAYLTPALATSKTLGAAHLSPYLSLPGSLGAMHLVNKGSREPELLALTSFISFATVAIQKLFKLPKAGLRSLMALFIYSATSTNIGKEIFDKLRKTKKQSSKESTKLNNNDKKKVQNQKNSFKLSKLFKVELQVNTIPTIVNWCIKKIQSRAQIENKLVGGLLDFIIRCLGLSVGFVSLGNLMTKLQRNKAVEEDDSSAIYSTGACECTGGASPVCISEVIGAHSGALAA